MAAKYITIAREIKKRIISQQYAANEPLPDQFLDHGLFRIPQAGVFAHPLLGKHPHRCAFLQRFIHDLWTLSDPAHPLLPTQG